MLVWANKSPAPERQNARLGEQITSARIEQITSARMLVWANKSHKNIKRCTKAAVRHDTSSHPGPRYEPSMTPRAKFPLDELPTDILHTIADIYRREKSAKTGARRRRMPRPRCRPPCAATGYSGAKTPPIKVA